MMAIESLLDAGDRGEVLRLVQNLIETLSLMSKRMAPDNYSVDGWVDGVWSSWLSGTRDFCVGYATAVQDYSPTVVRVSCGECVIWPSEWWLADRSLSLEALIEQEVWEV